MAVKIGSTELYRGGKHLNPYLAEPREDAATLYLSEHDVLVYRTVQHSPCTLLTCLAYFVPPWLEIHKGRAWAHLHEIRESYR
jgi:hypothetical protein